MNRKLLVLGIIHALVGIGAVPAGYLFLSEPDGSSMGMTTDALANSPFKDYFIPGLFLLIVNGIFNLVNAVLCLVKYRYAPFFSLMLGSAMLVWVLVQVWSIGLTHFLQPSYFVIGIVEIILSFFILFPKKK